MGGVRKRKFVRFLHRAVALIVACSFAASQVAAPPSNSQSAQAETFVVRINVNLVQVDAVVTDSKGKPVTDLKADDFEVFQDGKAQTITSFSYVSEGVKPAVAPVPAKSAPTAVPPPLPMKPSQVKRVIALVVDDLGLSPSSIAQVHSALKRFVEHDIQPGDVVAVMRTAAGVGALQQFTTDRRLLYAAIDRVRYNYNARVGSFTPINPAPMLDQNRSLTLPAMGSTVDPTQAPAGSEDASRGGIRVGSPISGGLEAVDACFRTTSSRASLAAVRYAVQGLRDLPGRKALVLFSESMQMYEPTETSLATFAPDANCDYSRVRDSFRKLTDAAERAAVVVYTVDPRGVDPLILGAEYNSLQGVHDMRDVSTGYLGNEHNSKRKGYRESLEGLYALAGDTGGTVALHNDMLGAIREAADDSANYYLIGYRPPINSFETKGEFKFHKVDVKVKRPGLKVRSRNGFFGFPGGEHNDPTLSREEKFARVLVSPFAENDIHLRMTSFFSHSEKSEVSTLLYIDGSDITFDPQPDGQYKAVIEAVAVTFDEDGQTVDDTQKIFTLRGNQLARDLAVKNGLVLTLQHVTEKPGPYQMRVAIRDAGTGRMGSANQFVEVPNLKRKRLALSGIMMRQQGTIPAAQTPDPNQSIALDPKGNEAIRIFQPGERVAWEFQIFNARTGNDQKPNVTVETRIFRDGTEIIRSEPVPVAFPANVLADHMAASGRLTLSSRFPPGDYALQVVVTDNLAKKKNAFAFQSIDFSIASP